MAEFTKEQLIEHARENVKSLKFASTQHAFEKAFPGIEIDIRLAEIALAALNGMEQEPVAWLLSGGGAKNDVRFDSSNAYADPLREVTPLYAAPQLPQAAVPDAISTRQAISKMEECEPCDSINVAYKCGWNACRAAMLQGAEPVSQPYTLRDGWVAVPLEPTEKMVIEGFESVPHPLFQPADWDKYQTMSGCEQAAHRAKLCWAAMIAAAPQQEV